MSERMTFNFSGLLLRGSCVLNSQSILDCTHYQLQEDNTQIDCIRNMYI